MFRGLRAFTTNFTQHGSKIWRCPVRRTLHSTFNRPSWSPFPVYQWLGPNTIRACTWEEGSALVLMTIDK